MKHRPSTDSQTARLERHLSLSRRQFLRGLGVCMALPVFESSMGRAFGAAAPAGPGVATTSTGAPLRMAFVATPNGVHQEYWWPKGEGSAFELGRTMQPLAALKDK